MLIGLIAQEEILQLAIDHPEQAVRNSATLRHFAVEVYAYDIAVPGQGCPGTVPASTATSASEPAVASSTSSAEAASSTSEAPAATTTEAAPATTVSSAAAECHTHSDGVVHCA